MIRTFLAEAIVAAKRMVRTLSAEAVVSLGAQRIVRLLAAGETRLVHPAAKRMPRMPVAEATPVDGLQPSFGGAPMLRIEQHVNRDGLGWRDDAPCARGARSADAGAEQEAVQQRAMRWSKSCHHSAFG
jgi:hypothetical protein